MSLSPALTASPKQAIAKGSKSFYLASLFFPSEMKESCWVIYRWCRHCDDVVDLAPDQETACLLLEDLKKKTEACLQGLPTGEPLFEAFGQVFREHQIPARYAFDLLRGFEYDVEGETYESLADVELYSYHVAGVVGLMMARLMGAEASSAAQPAKDMGLAMQLTNISRDVAEDFSRGRCYLPSQWLHEARVPEAQLMNPEHRQEVYSVVLRLLDRADELYASGYSGLGLLPFRAACAVAVAAEVYSAIGTKIRKRGPRALEQRTYIRFPEKIILTVKGLSRAILASFQRPLTEVIHEKR